VVVGSEVVELSGSLVGSSDGVGSASVVVNSGTVKGTVVASSVVSGSDDRKQSQRNYIK
jgi:hypothetical protein